MNRQLFLFEEPLKDKSKHIHWKIYIDGASRGNPGPSGAGIYVMKDGIFFGEYAFYLGKRTNNQAEYYALLTALFLVLPHIDPSCEQYTLNIISDSQLLVRQIDSVYKVKDSELFKLHAKALFLLRAHRYKMHHVMREDNIRADALANQGIDKKIPLPENFTAWITS